MVLDIGCGDGEETLAYAGTTAATIGIDPDTELIATARQETPDSLRNKIQFFATSIEDFVHPITSPRFDIAYFGWSL
jgi:predicted RNA methylase